MRSECDYSTLSVLILSGLQIAIRRNIMMMLDSVHFMWSHQGEVIYSTPAGLHASGERG